MDLLSFLIRMNILSSIYNRLVYKNKTYSIPQHLSSNNILEESRRGYDIETLINREFKPVKNHVRRLWGLLSIYERNLFLEV